MTKVTTTEKGCKFTHCGHELEVVFERLEAASDGWVIRLFDDGVQVQSSDLDDASEKSDGGKSSLQWKLDYMVGRHMKELSGNQEEATPEWIVNYWGWLRSCDVVGDRIVISD